MLKIFVSKSQIFIFLVTIATLPTENTSMLFKISFGDQHIYNGNPGQIFVEEYTNSLKGQVLKIECKKNQVFSLDQAFSVRLDCGETKTAYMNEDFVISQFYTNEDLYQKVGKEMCIALDVALGGTGYEAVVEGFYSLVKHHMKNNRQSNASFIQHVVVDWCMLHPIQCPNTIKNITKLYIKGNPKYGLKRHRDVFYYDKRGRAKAKYQIGEVIDHLMNEPPKCPHIVKDNLNS